MPTRDLLGTNLLIEADVGKAFNLDTILLSDFIRIPKGTKNILDIGTGNGAIMLYLSQKFIGKIIGVEIQTHRFNQALRNINMNHLEKRISVINADAKDFELNFDVDIVVSNPPFFKVNRETKRSIDADMEIAKHELSLNLESLIIATKKQLKNGGLFFMIHKPDRLDEIMDMLKKNDFAVKRLRFVHPTIDEKPNHILIESRYKGGSHLIIEPPLIQYQSKNVYSDEMNEIYRGRSYHK